MATLTSELEAEPRESTGKSANRQYRENSMIPAVVYGQDVENKNLVVRRGDIIPLLQDGALNNRLLDLVVEDEDNDRSVLIKDVDTDPVDDVLQHVDFQQVRPDDRVQVDVPVELTGESPGVELEGGIIDQPMRTLAVDCKVEDIPELIEVDIDELEIGDAVFVSDITPPSGVDLLDNEQQTIVSIQPPEEFDLETTPAEETEIIEETVEEAMEEVAEEEGEEEGVEEGEAAEGEGSEESFDEEI